MPELTYRIRLTGLDAVQSSAAALDEKFKKVGASMGDSLGKVRNAAASLGSEMQQLGSTMTSVGGRLSIGLTAPIAAAAGAMVKFGGDFESAMTTSLAIMGEIAPQMRDKMEDAAKRVAETTTFSATQAAEAYYFLASAGLDAAQSIEAMPQVAKFAQAGDFDLALATDLLTDAQSALGMTIRDDVVKNMENMARVSDVLVKANILANASVQQFSESLTTRAGAALRLVNKDVEEGVAVLSAWADQGVKGAEAGTRLDIVLRDLQGASLKNREAFEEMGISIFDSEGNIRNLADIIANMEQAFAGMSNETLRASLMQLGFQDRSIAATASLLGMSDAIKRYESLLRDAGGTTEDVASKQLESFNAQMKVMWNRIQVVAIESFQKTLLPILQEQVVPALMKAVEVVEGAVKWFTNLPGPVQGATVAVVGLVAAVGPLLLGLGSAVKFIGFAVSGLGSLTPILTALPAKITAVNAALAAGPLGVVSAVAVGGWAITSWIRLIREAKDELDLMRTTTDAFAQANGTAMARVAEQFGLSAEELKTLTQENSKAVAILTDHKEQLDAVRRSMGEGEGAQKLYLAALKELVGSGVTKANEALTANVEIVGKSTEAMNVSADAARKLTDAEQKVVEAFKQSLRPAAELDECLQLLMREGFGEHEIVNVFGKEIRQVAQEHARLNGPDSLPATVAYFESLYETLPKLNLPLVMMIENQARLSEEMRLGAVKIKEAEQELQEYAATASKLSLVPFFRTLRKLPPQLPELQAQTESLSKSMEDFREETKRTSDFADEWGRVWEHALGDVVSRFSESMAEMIGISNKVVKSLLEVFVSGFFSPMLSWIGNLAKEMGGWLGGLIGIGPKVDLGKSTLGKVGSVLTSPWTLGIGGVLGLGGLLWGKFTKSPEEKLLETFRRDFPGMVGDPAAFAREVLKLTDKQFKDVQKETATLMSLSLAFAPGASAAQQQAFIKAMSGLQVSGAVGAPGVAAGLPHRTDTAGNVIFDLSEAARMAVEEGKVSLLADQLDKVLGGSKRWIELVPGYRDLIDSILGVGEATEETLSQYDMLIQALEELRNRPVAVADALEYMAESIRILQEAGASSSEIMQLLGDDLVQLVGTAEGLGVEIPPVIESFYALTEVTGEMAETVQETASQYDVLIAALEELRNRPVVVAESLEYMAESVQILEGAGASSSEILQLLGGDLDRLTREAAGLGVEIPAVIQSLYDLTVVTEEGTAGVVGMTSATMVLAQSLGLAGNMAEMFAQGYDDVAVSMLRTENSAAILYGETVALFDLYRSQGLSVLDAQRRAWEQTGDGIIETYNSMIMLGQSVPTFLQQMMSWAEANDLVRVTADGASRATVQLMQVQQSAGRTSAQNLVNQAYELGSAIEAFGQVILEQRGLWNPATGQYTGSTADIVGVQLAVWRQYESQIIATAQAYDRFGLAIPANLQNILNFALERGLVTYADLREQIQSIPNVITTKVDPALQGSIKVFDDWGQTVTSVFDRAVSAIEEFASFEQSILDRQRLTELTRVVSQAYVTTAEGISSIVRQTLGINAELAGELVGEAIKKFDFQIVAQAGELLRRRQFTSLSEALEALLQARELAGQGLIPAFQSGAAFIRSTTVATLHPGEAVLTAENRDSLVAVRNALSNIIANRPAGRIEASGASGGAPVVQLTPNFNITISALDGADVRKVTRDKIIPEVTMALAQGLAETLRREMLGRGRRN